MSAPPATRRYPCALCGRPGVAEEAAAWEAQAAAWEAQAAAQAGRAGEREWQGGRLAYYLGWET